MDKEEKIELTERQKIELEILEQLLEDIQGMYPEYIKEYIQEEIKNIKYGI